MEEALIRQIVRQVVEGGAPSAQRPIAIEASARHVHLTQAALERLFGPEARLEVRRELSQPGEFLSDKRVKLITPKGEIGGVAVLGPVRQAVQVELCATDCRQLGLKAPVNLSGDLNGAADVVLLAEHGMLEAKGCVIIAKAHAHLRRADAAAYGVSDGQQVRVRVESLRPVTFDNVVVRVRDSFAPAVHVDYDEANACGGVDGAKAFLLGGPAVCMGGQMERQAPPLSWSELLVSEKTARLLVSGNEGAQLHLRAQTIVTPAARDIFAAAKVQLKFV